ncbi:UNVERIFIED_CONTAM: hypothetical protein FKN15_037177 [Acipenser sinensis]
MRSASAAIPSPSRLLWVVDYHSKFPEIQQLPDKTGATVIGKLKAIFARHGIPKVVVADNMPFASKEVHLMAAEWGFTFSHSSPNYAQSNGLAERTIQTVKHVLEKAMRSGTDPHLAVLTLRNTPISGMKYSPAQLLMGRVLRGVIPVMSRKLKPCVARHVTKQLAKQQLKQKAYYDRDAAPLKPFKAGDPVRLETTQGWFPATVQNVRREPRSYDVVTGSGRVYRRNRRHLRADHSERLVTLSKASSVVSIPDIVPCLMLKMMMFLLMFHKMFLILLYKLELKL